MQTTGRRRRLLQRGPQLAGWRTDQSSQRRQQKGGQGYSQASGPLAGSLASSGDKAGRGAESSVRICPGRG